MDLSGELLTLRILKRTKRNKATRTTAYMLLFHYEHTSMAVAAHFTEKICKNKEQNCPEHGPTAPSKPVLSTQSAGYAHRSDPLRECSSSFKPISPAFKNVSLLMLPLSKSVL